MAPKKNPAAVALGRMTSPAKARAARKNGRAGGRKGKFAIGDRVRGNNQCPLSYRDRVGTIDKIGPSRSEYGVAYTDGLQEHGYLMSWWIDLVKKA